MSDLIIEQLLAACGHTAEAKAAVDEIERLRELQKRDIAAARIRILEAEIERLRKNERLCEKLDKALCTLADLGWNEDMSRTTMQNKAIRIYKELRDDDE